MNWVVGWSNRAYSVRITQKSLQRTCRRMQVSPTVFICHSGLSYSVTFFSLICDAFAQSELTPLNSDKCNNALYSSELLNARFWGSPQLPYGAFCCLKCTNVVSGAHVKLVTWLLRRGGMQITEPTKIKMLRFLTYECWCRGARKMFIFSTCEHSNINNLKEFKN